MHSFEANYGHRKFLLKVDKQTTTGGYSYDGNGNPTAYKGASLKYDPESRLTQYGSAETNTYTGDGLRACKVFPSGGVTAYVWYVYDGDEPVAEVNGSGAATAAHTFGADGLVSRKVPGGDEFYTFDSQGSTAQQLDSGGNVLCSYLHDGFGNWVASASGADDVFGWGGQFGYYTDSQTGLRLCGHRFYDNGTARWLTRDPVGYGGGVNLYGYCTNDPVNGIDPVGFSKDRSKQECDELWTALQALIKELDHRRADMLNDRNNIYIKDPGDWKRHQEHYEAIKRAINRVETALNDKNCYGPGPDMTPVKQPCPSRPTRWEDPPAVDETGDLVPIIASGLGGGALGDILGPILGRIGPIFGRGFGGGPVPVPVH